MLGACLLAGPSVCTILVAGLLFAGLEIKAKYTQTSDVGCLLAGLWV